MGCRLGAGRSRTGCMKLCAQLMHRIDHYPDILGVRPRVQAVPEIENVPWPRTVAVQDRLHFLPDSVR